MLNKLVKIVLKKGFPEGIDLLNVNVPANPSDDEFEISEKARQKYREKELEILKDDLYLI